MTQTTPTHTPSAATTQTTSGFSQNAKTVKADSKEQDKPPKSATAAPADNSAQQTQILKISVTWYEPGFGVKQKTVTTPLAAATPANYYAQLLKQTGDCSYTAHRTETNHDTDN